MLNRMKVWSIADREGLAYGEDRWYVTVQNGQFNLNRKITREHALQLIKRFTNNQYDWQDMRDSECRINVWQMIKLIK